MGAWACADADKASADKASRTRSGITDRMPRNASRRRMEEPPFSSVTPESSNRAAKELASCPARARSHPQPPYSAEGCEDFTVASLTGQGVGSGWFRIRVHGHRCPRAECL